MPRMCPEADMLVILQAIRETDERTLDVLNQSLRTWPRDPRIHLLVGAMHASRQVYESARSSFEEALRLSPDYPIASFMLGFLELVNGHPESADSAWTALDALPADDTLRIFRSGLSSLVENRFDDALLQLRHGIAMNERYPLINHYVRTVIAAIDRDSAPRDGSARAAVDPSILAGRYDTPSRS